MIVVDAGVLIAHLDADDAHHATATDLLLRAGNEALGASAITIAEVLVRPARRGQLDTARSALSDLAVRDVPLPADASVRLAVLRAET